MERRHSADATQRLPSSEKVKRLTKMSLNVMKPEHRVLRQLSTLYLRSISVGDWHFGPVAIGVGVEITSAKFN